MAGVLILMSISFKDIKNLQKNKKARDEQGLFVTEGIKLCSEAPDEWIEAVFATAEFNREYPDFFSSLPDRIQVVNDIKKERFAGLSDTKSPQGILTVVRKPVYDLEKILSEPDSFFMLLENIQDPGNAGTILRTAEAAGVDAVFLTEGAVDLYNPKTIRSTMGSIYRVPHFYVHDVDKLLDIFAERGIITHAAHLHGTHNYTDADYTGGTAFMIGNESRGLSDALSARANVLMKIPMCGRVESLNAAMASGILMYEARRQRDERRNTI